MPNQDAWLVGGSVRDLLLERPVVDVDLVVDGDPGRAARAVARSGGGTAFPLSERHGAWRIARQGCTVDVAAARGSIADDLALRDFTINAMAIPLRDGDILDPHGGREDLERRSVRMVSPSVFDDDPLRLLRLARIAHQVGFQPEEETLQLARRRASLASRPSGERIFTELRRLLAPVDPADGIRLLDAIGALDPVLPELAATKGLEQNRYHALDVFEHTLQVLDAVSDVVGHPEHYLPAHADLVARRTARIVGDELPAWHALRIAALFHDIAKPRTSIPREQGFGFPGHDREGARMAASVLRRWRTSNALVKFCSTMVASHLMLGFSVRGRPLGRRDAYRYLRATGPWAVESVLLSLADRLSTRGRGSKLRHLRAHTETAGELLGLLCDLEGEERPPLLRGDEIAGAAGVRGPQVRKLVDALAEEQAAGTITTRDEALRFVARQPL